MTIGYNPCKLFGHVYTFAMPPRRGVTYRCANCDSAPVDGSFFFKDTSEGTPE